MMCSAADWLLPQYITYFTSGRSNYDGNFTTTSFCLTPFLPSFPSLPHSQNMYNMPGYIVCMEKTDSNYFASVVEYHCIIFLSM